MPRDGVDGSRLLASSVVRPVEQSPVYRQLYLTELHGPNVAVRLCDRGLACVCVVDALLIVLPDARVRISCQKHCFLPLAREEWV